MDLRRVVLDRGPEIGREKLVSKPVVLGSDHSAAWEVVTVGGGWAAKPRPTRVWSS